VEDVAGLVEYWTGEYEKYSGEVKKFQVQNEDRIRMKAGHRQRGGGRGWR
jgi:hypothetical protein